METNENLRIEKMRDPDVNQLPRNATSSRTQKSSTPAVKTERPAWRKWFYRFICHFYFQRITLIHPERLPKSGPALFLGLHRNGAVDGFVYDCALGGLVFMISTQLRKNWFARIFFDGIAVARSKDEGDRTQNDGALRQCLAHLHNGGRLFVFPEGTSTLGPRHLPFKSGAIWLMLDYLERGGPPLPVLPVGIHYECPPAFRGRVEVVVGRPISTDLPAAAGRMERLKIMKRRMQEALEDVGINVPSDEYQEQIQRFAYAATLGSPRSYFKSLKAMETSVPGKILERWQTMEPDLRKENLWLHQGVPLFPIGPVALYLLASAVIGPIVFVAVAVNLPAFLAGWFAGKKCPDGRNVISLWKILAGVPVFVIWMSAVVAATLLFGKIWWLMIYFVLTAIGLKLYCRFKKLAVAVYNGLLFLNRRSEVLAFHQTVLQSLPNETD